MLERYRNAADVTPCRRCASMKLTEAKFIISEYSRHQRHNRPAKRDRHGHFIDNNLGPDGLGFGRHEFELGNLEELFGRREECPFCGLAVTSLNEQYKELIEDPNVRVWTESDFYKANVTCFLSMCNLSLKIRCLTRNIPFTNRTCHCTNLTLFTLRICMDGKY